MNRLLVPLLLLTSLALPLGSAATYNVGVTGSCFDEEGGGGAAMLVFRTGTNPVVSVAEFKPLDAVAAVVAFVDEPDETAVSNGCSSNAGVDWVEAHAWVDPDDDGDYDVFVNACYSGSTSNIVGNVCYAP